MSKKIDDFIKKIKNKSKLGNTFLIENKSPESYLSSFIGNGIGYLPEDFNIPENMKIILQINFSEMPKLKNFPTEGVLQVWCSGDQMFDKENNEGLIVYHKDLKLKQQKIDKMNFDIEDPFYIEEALSIKFKEQTETIAGFYTSEFEEFEDEFNNFDRNEEQEFYEKYENISEPIHYVGGIPYYTQYEVRERNEICLVQLGYCSNLCIGDAGTFQVFIEEEDLINLNFDNAWCYWDCH